MTRGGHDLWRPTSGCGPACLPVPGQVPAVSAARWTGRLAAGLGMLLVGVGLAALLPLLPARERRTMIRGWARVTARALGVRLVARGRLPRQPALLVANHASWLDALAVLAVAPACLVAKSDIRAWPVIGRLAGAAGAVFVDRTRPRDLPGAVARMAAALRAGRPVAVFPEGTTWCGSTTGCRPVGGFRPAAFQAAIDVGVPVVPLRLGYRCATTEATTTAAFLGDETLWRSLRRVLAARELEVSVVATAALHPTRDTDRGALARAAEAAVRLPPARPPRPPVPAPRPVRPILPGGTLDLAT
ncbi:lysophospholipid acyltransferase family protein [Salinispora arenicola]|uniref:lysophospholipid acyltransferase family protein n=1 Tax=Salinispora arenicola TaxID=168697 RepID=UPI000373D9D3|nr:lysophospholipid acyltransferase family protein [Salinispora arenicola]